MAKVETHECSCKCNVTSLMLVSRCGIVGGRVEIGQTHLHECRIKRVLKGLLYAYRLYGESEKPTLTVICADVSLAKTTKVIFVPKFS